MMAGDAIREFVDQIDTIPHDCRAIDVLIHSAGGDALSAWKLMSLLRERFEKVGVLVPFMAFSAATLFALGADEIVMHPHASLGPIDPQIRMTQADEIREYSPEHQGQGSSWQESPAAKRAAGYLPSDCSSLGELNVNAVC